MTDRPASTPPASEKSTPFDALLNGFVRPGEADGKPEATPPGKRERYREFLRQQGFRVDEDEDRDFWFRREGQPFVLWVEEDDEGYFRIGLPANLDIADDEQRSEALRVANEVNLKYKAVKVEVFEKTIWLYVEAFYDPLDGFAKVFDRILNALVSARRELQEKAGE